MLDVQIASPCPVRWGEMTGDERKRLCRKCDLHVYNIAQMTNQEVEELITKTESRVCALLFRRRDGTVITKDCPFRFRENLDRSVFLFCSVVAATLGWLGFVYVKETLDVAISRAFSAVAQPLGQLTCYSPGSSESLEANDRRAGD